MDERQLVDAIRLVIDGSYPGVRVGVGDDAAVVEAGTGDLVLAADMLVEGADFFADRVSPRALGAKAIAVNLSDLAAMGASPRYVLVSLGLPASIDVPWVIDLYGGMRDVAEEFACTIVGGDLSSAKELVVSVSVAGSVSPGKAITRAGARPGDAIVVTGGLGAAAGGLMITSDPKAARLASTDEGRALTQALARPIPRVAEGQFLASCGATAMIDLSDGLSRDLHRLCRASGVGALVDEMSIPVHPALLSLADHLPADPATVARIGGEDFELLATIDAQDLPAARADFEEAFFTDLIEIGRIVAGDAVQLITGDGTVALPDEGWDHFAR